MKEKSIKHMVQNKKNYVMYINSSVKFTYTVNFCGCLTLHSVLYDCSRVGCNEIVVIHNNNVHYYCFIDFINVLLFNVYF